MAEVIFAVFGLSEIIVEVFHENTTLELTRVEITTGAQGGFVSIQKITPPKKKYGVNIPPNTHVVYDIPKGFKFDLELDDNWYEVGYIMSEDIIVYARSG